MYSAKNTDFTFGVFKGYLSVSAKSVNVLI